MWWFVINRKIMNQTELRHCCSSQFWRQTLNLSPVRLFQRCEVFFWRIYCKVWIIYVRLSESSAVMNFEVLGHGRYSCDVATICKFSGCTQHELWASEGCIADKPWPVGRAHRSWLTCETNKKLDHMWCINLTTPHWETWLYQLFHLHDDTTIHTGSCSPMQLIFV